ncbi:hypothetical protein AAC387_Pa01g1227 [Persea americana]
MFVINILFYSIAIITIIAILETQYYFYLFALFVTVLWLLVAHPWVTAVWQLKTTVSVYIGAGLWARSEEEELGAAKREEMDCVDSCVGVPSPVSVDLSGV